MNQRCLSAVALLTLACGSALPACLSMGGSVDVGWDLEDGGDMGDSSGDGDDGGDMGDSTGDGQDEPVAILPCDEACAQLQQCGAVSPEADCPQICSAEVPPGVFSGECQQCMAGSCQDASACLADRSVCGQPLATQITVEVLGLPAPAGSWAQATILFSDDVEVTTPVTARVSTEGVALFKFADILQPGVDYRLVYFVDTDGDGSCAGATDVTGQEAVLVEEGGILAMQQQRVWGGDVAQACGYFRSRQELCAERCAAEQACELVSRSDVDCSWDCALADVAVTALCVECVEGRSCTEQVALCAQPGGVCDPTFSLPNVVYAAIVQGGEEAIGIPAHGILLDADHELVKRSSPVFAVRETGEATLNFGLSLHLGRQYFTAVFLDRSGDGECSEGDDVYLWASAPIDVLSPDMHIWLLALQDAVVTDCASILGD